MKPEKHKSVNPTVSEKSLEFFTEYFQSVNSGATYALESFAPLFKRTLAEIKGRLSANELKLIVDVFNGTALTPMISGQHLYLQCDDAITLDKIDKKWGIDPEVFLDKISALTNFQTSVLEIWANGFWYGKKHLDHNRDLEEYVSALSE